MDLLLGFQFSLLTLSGFFLVPLLYYGYHAKYWYLPQKIKFYDFLTLCVAGALALLVTLKLRLAGGEQDRFMLQLILLHYAPLVIAFLAVAHGKRYLRLMLSGRSAPQQTSSATDFTPQRMNRRVQRMTWDDLIIPDALREELNSVITLLKDPRTARSYGIEVPKGILLSGPPGNGKTSIAKVMASTAGLAFFAVRADELVSKWVGDSEKNFSKLFEAARRQAPSVIFIDEIDSFGKRRSGSNPAYADNLLNHLLQLIDGVVGSEGVYVIAATNRADLVDEALKRTGRLDRVIEVPRPDLETRRKLFLLYLSRLSLAGDVDLESLTASTEGFSAANIKGICNQAGLHAFRRESAGGQRHARNFLVTRHDLERALSELTAQEQAGRQSHSSAPAPVNAHIEALSWNDIVIDRALREELDSVIALLKDPATAERYGIRVPKGILFNGPPGTGKTTIAKIMANIAGLSFFSVQSDEIVSKWVGESEKNLSALFASAERHAPAVIFIDEVDSIGKLRGGDNAPHAESLLNHLLQLVDGVVKREGLYIIAATNRADLVDPALKRAGRLAKTIEIPLPGFEARCKLFELYLSKLPLEEVIDVERLARQTDNKSGADIMEICSQAGLNAFKRESADGQREYMVRGADIEAALQEFTGGTGDKGRWLWPKLGNVQQ